MSIFDFQRLDNILNLLIQKNEPIHINELSSFCGVSDRTIRSDIHTINDYITENGATITLIRKKGYVINYIDKEKFDKFWTNQDSGTFYSLHLIQGLNILYGNFLLLIIIFLKTICSLFFLSAKIPFIVIFVP